MTRRWIIAASVGLVIVAGTAMLAAPGQGTRTPGQPTEGRVWIENRGRNEAIPIAAQDPLPVVVQNVTMTAPIAVRLAGPTSTQPHPPVVVQSAQQTWEYRTIAIPGNANAQTVTNLLTAQGNQGFELAVQLPAESGSLLVLKRPR